MAIRLSRIGHTAVRVWNIKGVKKFYKEVMGFRIVEGDPGRGGVFRRLGHDDTIEGHTFDISPVEDPKPKPRWELHLWAMGKAW